MITINTTGKIDWCKKRPKNCSEYMYSTGYYNKGEFRNDVCKIINYLIDDNTNQIEGEFITVVRER